GPGRRRNGSSPERWVVSRYLLRLQHDQASGTTTIHAPVDAIWQMISDFARPASISLWWSTVRVRPRESARCGALTSFDDRTIVERLETVDQAAHRLSYALLTDNPLTTG
ncbi:MAG TPA: SRPBCC family protein, partial [Anaerolineae bacterium]|nr:SRPBCC family protein [Anaerolineae bacterium]